MKFEYQISIEHIEAVLLEQLELYPMEGNTKVNIAGGRVDLAELQFGSTRLLASGGAPLVVSIENESERTSFATSKLRFEQDVIAQVTPSKRRNAARTETTRSTYHAMTMLFDVSMDVQTIAQHANGSSTQLELVPGAAIIIALTDIRGLPEAARKQLPSYRVSIPLELSAIAKLLGKAEPVTAAAMMVSRRHGFVSLQVQLGAASGAQTFAWQTFFAGQIEPRLVGRSWGLFVDGAHEGAIDENATVFGDQRAFLQGARHLWQNALRQASAVALVWVGNRLAYDAASLPGTDWAPGQPLSNGGRTLLPELFVQPAGVFMRV